MLHAAANGFPYAEGSEEREHQHAGNQAADEEVLDGDLLRDDAIKDERHRQWEEQSKRSGCREQTDGEPFAVTLSEERRQQQPTEREDRHARSAGEEREERAQRRGGDGGAARRPAKERAQGTQQPFR